MKTQVALKTCDISEECAIKSTAKSKIFKRTILGILMLSGFIFLCKSDKIYIILFTVWLSFFVNKEIINVIRKQNRPFAINRFLVYYFKSLIFFEKLLPSITIAYPQINIISSFGRLRLYIFSFYTGGLILFILNLKKGKVISQLSLLSVIHLSSYLMGSTCSLAISNIMKGSFYYFYPCVLVITNDIAAYVVGKCMGKIPLFELSPKKTLEGFIGASIVTLTVGIFLSYLKISFGLLPDNFDDQLKKVFDENIWYLNIPTIYIHNIAFAFGASFVAPFSGFMASAIKRAFKKKDFGDVIPGHGGLADRMDCQIMMVYFTHFYLQAFMKAKTDSVEEISTYIVQNFDYDSILEIIGKLKEKTLEKY